MIRDIALITKSISIHLLSMNFNDCGSLSITEKHERKVKELNNILSMKEKLWIDFQLIF